MSAAALLLTLQAAGASVRVERGNLVVQASDEVMSPLVLSELRDRKRQVLALLTGDSCRYCEGPIDWRRPGGVAFADGTAGHLGCYEEAEVARLLTSAERAPSGVTGTSDEGELLEADL